MNKKRKYICSVCGKDIYLFPEEFASQNVVICECCQQRINEQKELRDNVYAYTAKKVVSGVKKFINNNYGENTTINGRPNTDNIGQKIINGATEILGIKNTCDNQINNNSDFSQWICIGNLYDAYINRELGKYGKYIGLYMHTVNGEIKYIGRAIEYNNGGFRKRLSDYCRDSNSARKHPSGQTIYANRYNIVTYILPVGNDEEAKQETIELEKDYVSKYNPPWNDKLKSDNN